MVMFKLLTSEL